eukprot:symbB.v1.2.015622.t1/scaffold1162.1/size134634/9
MGFGHVLPVLVACAASSLLHIPAREGRTSEVAQLIDHGGPKNCCWKDGQTPVMSASLAGHAEVVEFLIQRGCNVTIGDKDGYKPLDASTWMGHLEVVEVLMKYSSPEKLHSFHSDGFAPIHRACWGDGLLVAAGRTWTVFDPFFLDSGHQHSKVVRSLIEAGVDPQLRASNGSTCLQLSKRQETIDLLTTYEVPRPERRPHATAKTEL